MLCAYFHKTTNPDAPPNTVESDGHESEPEGPLFFFVPLPNGDAVRIPVCQEHCDVLTELYA